MIKKIIFLSLLAPILASAYYNPGPPVGFVNDYANLFSNEQKQALENKLTLFEKDSTNEISVVTIKSLEGDSIENFANELFNEWGVGKKGQDNGILILVALDDRKMRVEVGYGLEGALTDAQSYQVLDKIMAPAFREEDYYKGVDGAIDQIIGTIKGEVVPVPEKKGTMTSEILKLLISSVYFFAVIFVWFTSIFARSKSWWMGGITGGAMGLIIGLITYSMLAGIIAIAILVPLGLFCDFTVSRVYRESKKKRRKIPWWAGGGGISKKGGGFWGKGGFGGGSSGGGGASGRW